MRFILGYSLDFFSRVGGLDRDVLQSISLTSRFSLAFTSLWSIAGMLLCGLSTQHLLQRVHALPELAIASGLVVTLLLLMLQAMLVSNGAHSAIGEEALLNWRPSPFRTVTVLMIAFVFSQPVMLYMHTFKTVSEYLPSQTLVAKGTDRAVSQAPLTRLHQEIVYRNNLLKQMDLLRLIQSINPLIKKVEDFKSQPEANAAPRRALLIANTHNSRDHIPLLQPLRDVDRLKKELIRVGFDVDIVKDVNLEEMYSAIENYRRKLQQGEISLFYYSGYSLSKYGNPRMLATNSSEGAGEIPLSLLIDRLKGRGLQANILLMDAYAHEDADSKDAPSLLDPGTNNCIAISQIPYPSNDAGSNSFSPIASALMKKIDKFVGITDILKSVKSQNHLNDGDGEYRFFSNLDSNLILASIEFLRKKQSTASAPVRFGSTIGMQDLFASPCFAEASHKPDTMQRQWLTSCVSGNIFSLKDELKRFMLSPSQGLTPLKSKDKAEFVVGLIGFDRMGGTGMIWMLIITLLLSSGVILRDFLFKGIREYEISLIKGQRTFISSAYQQLSHSDALAPGVCLVSPFEETAPREIQ